MSDTDIKSCPFCKWLNEMKNRDEYYINNKDGRTGQTECKYGIALVHDTYYNGWHCGHSTYDTEPLNYCPVCGIKIKEENHNENPAD